MQYTYVIICEVKSQTIIVFKQFVPQLVKTKIITLITYN